MPSTSRARTEDWLNAHARAVGMAIAICGLLWRLYNSSDLYLSPDESLHYTAATHDWHGWTGFYRNAILPLHPPLFVPVLQGMLLFGQSEWLLRLVPMMAGSLFPWFVMLWLQRFAGNAAALSAQLLLTFSPSLIYLSMEVRAYTLAFMFLSICLLLLDKSLDHNNIRYMIWFHVFLYLAILTEYCVAWFAAALGAYALLRLWRNPESHGLRAAFVVGQVGALGLFLFLYFTHIGKLSHTGLEGMYSTWLQDCFAQPQEHSLVFALKGTYQQFIYLFEVRWLALIGVIAFCFGLYRLWREKSSSHAILLVLPFCAACLGALLHLFPYGATRHTAILGIAIAAGSGIAFAGVARNRIVPILIVALPVILLWNVLSTQQSLSIPRFRQHLSAMHKATDFLKNRVPAGSVVVMDQGTDLMLGYYLGCPDHGYFDSEEPNRMRPCTDLQFVVGPSFQFSGFSELRATLLQVKAKYQLERPVWVAAGGFFVNVENPASEANPFGKTIAIFKDSDLPVTPAVSR
jgi:Dolichyl-phosphate-mannose-protein mannosyltransferase